jgi:uncharacterized repeat protein (TIGR01451 family)
MKNKFLLKVSILITILFSHNNNANAQWVTIPDPNFVLFLQENYPTCMNGDQMDTACTEIVNESYLSCQYLNIDDLDGIQYFSGLEYLDCDNNNLTYLPELPNLLSALSCSFNQLTSLPELPNSIIDIDVENNQLTSLPELPTSLYYFKCIYNQLMFLPELPTSLYGFDCSYNQLTSLPELPDSLFTIDCASNQISTLPELPTSLQYINCSNNELSSLPVIPSALSYLNCSGNQLTSLPESPLSLIFLNCSYNQLSSVPANLFGYYMTVFDCSNNQITELPPFASTFFEVINISYNLLTSIEVLPRTFGFLCSNNLFTSFPEMPGDDIFYNYFDCSHNLLTTIPNTSLGNSVDYFNCSFNQLAILHEIPRISENGSYKLFDCSNNQLTALPEIPNTYFNLFNCSNNNISCFPIFPEEMYDLFYISIDNNPLTCLPNYTYTLYENYLYDIGYPLCEFGDFINNPNNCESAQVIKGNLFKDVNGNCVNVSTDMLLENIPIHLYDELNNLISTTYTAFNGGYSFYQFSGTYTVLADTLNKPYISNCPEIGIDSSFTLSANMLIDSINFAMECKTGFDVGVQSMFPSGLVFPGQSHELYISVGDLSNWYNLNCATGTSGTVQINVTGSVAYTGTPENVLVPDVIDGNNFTYNITDFGTVPLNSFGLLFLTDTTAQAGEEICVTATVTPNGVDNDTTNNTLTYCYSVVNSYDPNEKEVYPTSVLPGYDGYFTYTIHFQNTGTAPAINIKVQDTLSTNLDLSTFEITAYSHPNNTTLSGNLSSFKFPNIWLPDSTSDLEGSKGFVQYRIKPIANLPVGTQITNTAYIYFDYNSPIQTNTTESNFEIIQSLKTYSKGKVSVYPNPNNGIFHINMLEKNTNEKTMELTNIVGEKVWSQKTRSNTATIDINHLPKGLYILNVTDNNSHYMERIIKQ